jgi:phosphodiesterase/alkaline phosphatase D-like protein
MSVVSMVVGATTPDGATFAVKVNGRGPVRVAVADNLAMSEAVFTTSQAVDAQGVAKVTISGLAPATRYWWRVEDAGVLDTSRTGQFRTHPPVGQPASFTFAAAGDAGGPATYPGSGSELVPDRMSNHPVFNTIRARGLAGDWLFFLHLGDMHYYNLGQAGFPAATVANYRRGYDDVLAQSRQAGLYRDVPLVHVWDDHEYGPNDSDRTHPGKAQAQQVYREREPHYPLAEAAAIYHAFQIGRVQFVMWDLRSERSPRADPDGPSKTMLGAAQKAWFADLLATSDARILVVASTVQWIVGGPGGESWGSFATERQAVANLINDAGWANRTFMISADAHMLALDSGAGNAWGGWPTAVFAALDANPSGAGSEYDLLQQPGRNQYGTVEIRDLGSQIAVRLSAWKGEKLQRTHLFAVPTGSSTAVSAPMLKGRSRWAGGT